MTVSNTHDDSKTEESGGDRPCRPDEARLDTVFGVLSDARRRRVIRILRADARETISAAALADALAEHEPGAPSTRELVVSLRNVHLPKLDDAGIVDYDPNRSRIRYDASPLVERLLDRL